MGRKKTNKKNLTKLCKEANFKNLTKSLIIFEYLNLIKLRQVQIQGMYELVFGQSSIDRKNTNILMPLFKKSFCKSYKFFNTSSKSASLFRCYEVVKITRNTSGPNLQ